MLKIIQLYAIAGLFSFFVFSPFSHADTLVGTIPGEAGVSSSGAATYQIPIDVPPGINGLQPNLALSYNSHRGGGLLGLGWKVSGISEITRCVANIAQDGFIKAVDFDNDRFCLDGQKLKVVSGVYGGVNAEYRMENSPGIKVRSVGGTVGHPEQWEMNLQDGKIGFFGDTANARLLANDLNNSKPLKWGLSVLTDSSNNSINYTYINDRDNGALAPQTIQYNNNKITLKYEAKKSKNKPVKYFAGSSSESIRRLQKININNGTEYNISYTQSKLNDYDLVSSINHCFASICTAETKFNFNDKSNNSFSKSKITWPDTYFSDSQNKKMGTLFVDINNDGYEDIIQLYFTIKEYYGGAPQRRVFLGNEKGFRLSTEYSSSLPDAYFIGGANHDMGTKIVDINGDNLPDLIQLYLSPSFHYGGKPQRRVFLNTGIRFLKSVSYSNSLSDSYFSDDRGLDMGTRLADLNGDGLKDIIQIYLPNKAFYEKKPQRRVFLNSGKEFVYNQAFSASLHDTYFSDNNMSMGTTLVDLNNDGRMDIVQLYLPPKEYYEGKPQRKVFLSQGTKFNYSEKYSNSLQDYYLTGPTGQDMGTRFEDINGDGYPDVVQLFYQRNGDGHYGAEPVRRILLNNGTEFVSPPLGRYKNIPDAYFTDQNNIDMGTRLADFNDDGLVDIIQSFYSNNGDYGDQPRRKIFLNNGKNFIEDEGLSTSFGGRYFSDSSGLDMGTRLVDIDGDGYKDMVQSFLPAFPGQGYYKGVPQKNAYVRNDNHNLLESVENELTGNISFTYKNVQALVQLDAASDSSTSSVAIPPPAHKKLVSTLKSSIESKMLKSISYSYKNSRVNLTGLGDLGFESITRTDNTTGIVTTTTYSQDWQNRTVGRPVDVTTHLGNVQLSRTVTQYDSLQKNGVFFSYPSVSTSVTRDLNGAFINSHSTEQSYDLFGSQYNYQLSQATECVSSTDPSINNAPIACSTLGSLVKKTITNNQYYFEGYVVNHPPMLSRQSVTSEVYNGVLPFGQLSQQTRTQAFDYDTATGLLKTTIAEPDNNALRLTTGYAYNSRGQQTSVTVSGGDISPRTSTLNYSNTAPYNLLSNTNPLGQSESYQYSDSRFPWLPTKVTAINGVESTLTYDSLGRKASQTAFNQTATWSYAWCDNCDGVTGAKYKVTQTQTNQADSVSYYDQRQRIIETRTSGLREGYVSGLRQTTEYDALGRVVKTSLPYYEGDTPLYRVNQYDVLDRVVKETQPNGNLRVQTFNGRTTTIKLQTVDGTLQKQEITNALGQLVQTNDNQGNAVHFQYDTFGNLVRTTDPDNHQIILGYDLLGRKTKMSDPDKGNLSYQYYATGQLKSQTDANGNTHGYTYDVLGRRLTETAPEGKSTWIYDNCLNGIGQLCQKTGHGLTESYTYTAQGNLAQSSTTIDGLNYTYTHGYDTYGRQVSTQYPTGYTTQTHYHSVLGFANKVTHNSTVIWEAKSYNANGQLENMAMNNGAIQRIKYYEDGEDQVRQLNVIANNQYIASIDYDWSKTGNLRAQTDNTNLIKFGYTYDSLSRLKSTTTTVAGNNYGTVSLNYNALGNITQKSDVGTYTYNQTQCGRQAGPHAVSSITSKGAYCYDQNGNLLSGDNRSLTYNSFDKPTYIQQNGENTTFSYGPDRQRYKQVTTGTVPKTVYYIGGYEKEIRGNRIYHRIQIGDVAIVDKVDNHNETINYTLRDHLGSLIATVSDSGTVKRLFYDPWGKRLDLPVPEAQSLVPFNLANFLTPRGFTGHEHLDNVGLIHMNGRVYDPEIARFVSADPLIPSPKNLQSYNRYSYTVNNPLRYTDPSGFRMVDAEHTGNPDDNNESDSRFGRESDRDNNSGSSNNKSGSSSGSTKQADGSVTLSEMTVSAPRYDDDNDRRNRGDNNGYSHVAAAKVAQQKAIITVTENSWDRSFDANGLSIVKRDVYGKAKWVGLTGLGNIIDWSLKRSLNLDFEVKVQNTSAFELYSEYSLTTTYEVSTGSLATFNSKILKVGKKVLTGRQDWIPIPETSSNEIIDFRVCSVSCSLFLD